MNRIRIFLSVLVMLLIFVSCKNASVKSGSVAKDPVEGLVFLTFTMRNDTVSGKEIRLTGKTIVHEKLKVAVFSSDSPNRLLITQLNSAGKKLSSVAVDHPLFRRVEFANDQGQFQSKEIKLTDAEFFVRVTLYAETEYIQAEEELSGTITYTTKFKLRD